MKSLLKNILRKLGLLKLIRILRYRIQYSKLIRQFKGQSQYSLSYNGRQTLFSLHDPFSAAFFATHFKNGPYEKEGLRVLLEEMNQQGVVFDVGANIGYFTCLIAHHCGDAHVHAFEMGGENFRILKNNIALNGLKNVVAIWGAVSDTSGVVKVIDSPVGNAVLKIVDYKIKGDDLVPVNSISLDDYCVEKNVLPDIVKIDVEGAEMKVLQGMKKILAGPVKLLIEIHEKDLAYFKSSKEEVIVYLESSGYKLTAIESDVKKNLLVLASK